MPRLTRLANDLALEGAPHRATSLADVLAEAQTKAMRHPAHFRVRVERPLEEHKRATPATQSLRVPTLCAPNIPPSNVSDQNYSLTKA